MDKKTALKYLNKNRMLNIDMIDSVESNESEVIYAGDNGVLLYVYAGDSYLISADYDVEKILVCAKPDADVFLAHQDFYIPLIKEQFGLKSEMRCYTAVYTKPNPPEYKIDCEIRQLTLDYLDIVAATYSHVNNREYLERRIKDNYMFGAFSGGELMGYIGIHDEGAMGMLEVLPEHRRKGIGYALEAYLIGDLLKKGRVPYAHIIEDNFASLSLQKKLGMDIIEDKVTWIFK
ncbi:MAG TPA: GNAT family N-acetyltransferase [Clostridia bacterium]